MWASSILFSYGIVSSTEINCCVEAEWLTISALSLVSLIILGYLSHSGRSAETFQSSQPSSRHFLWCVVLTGLPCHDLAPRSVVDINEFVFGRVVSSLAVLMIAASCLRTLFCLHVYRFRKSSRHAPWCAFFGIADEWGSLSFPTVPEINKSAKTSKKALFMTRSSLD